MRCLGRLVAVGAEDVQSHRRGAGLRTWRERLGAARDGRRHAVARVVVLRAARLVFAAAVVVGAARFARWGREASGGAATSAARPRTRGT